MDVDLASGRARVQGHLPAGAKALIAALAQEDYPATVALGAANASTAEQSPGCQGKNDSQGGCCCH